jgi:hypothetical protein
MSTRWSVHTKRIHYRLEIRERAVLGPVVAG